MCQCVVSSLASVFLCAFEHGRQLCPTIVSLRVHAFVHDLVIGGWWWWWRKRCQGLVGLRCGAQVVCCACIEVARDVIWDDTNASARERASACAREGARARKEASARARASARERSGRGASARQRALGRERRRCRLRAAAAAAARARACRAL